MSSTDFQEIAHSGGKVTFTFRTTPDGQRGVQVGTSSSRPVPTSLIVIYATHHGVPVATMSAYGIGEVSDAPPFPYYLPVHVQSDSEGKFGHNCPDCDGYWRSGPLPGVCPYCNFRAPGHAFLSTAQQRYVSHYCETLLKGMDEIENGNVVIDMDAVADAAVKDAAERPAFYVSEQSQQHRFVCEECEGFNDILGRFGYCSQCGTRRDLAEFSGITIAAIRQRINAGSAPHDGVRDAVAAFDTFVAQYAKQLALLIPLSKRRATRLTSGSFHDLEEFLPVFRDWFDIDLTDGIKESELAHVKVMFFRRHLYEHNGGEVDEKYLAKSGDTTVRLKQVIRETQEGTHALLGSLLKMARNLHAGFHQLIPVENGPIRHFAEKQKRIADARGGR